MAQDRDQDTFDEDFDDDNEQEVEEFEEVEDMEDEEVESGGRSPLRIILLVLVIIVLLCLGCFALSRFIPIPGFGGSPTTAPQDTPTLAPTEEPTDTGVVTPEPTTEDGLTPEPTDEPGDITPEPTTEDGLTPEPTDEVTPTVTPVQGPTATPGPTVVITVVPDCSNNTPPTADADGPYEAMMGKGQAVVIFDGSASTDADGDIVSYEWDFGDGNSGTGESVSHGYSSTGAYSVTLTVTDDCGDTAQDTADVTVIGPTPPADEDQSDESGGN